MTALFLLAWAATPAETRAQQWTTSGSDISNTNTGNVGVGTASPGVKLDVVGFNGIRVSHPTNAYFVSNWTDSSGQGGLTFTEGGITKGGFQLNGGAFPTVSRRGFLELVNTVPTGGISFWTNTTQRITIDPSGNLGVGTSSPNAKLVVASGNFGLGTNSLAPWTAQTSVIESLDTSIFFGTDTDLGLNSNAYHNNGWKYKTADPAANIHLYKGDIYFRTAASGAADSPLSWTNSMFISSGGKVGVGTTAPATALHVVGDVTVTGNIAAKYQDVAEWVPSSQQLQAGTVVVLDPSAANHVVSSTSAYDTAVAGVVTEQPGLILGEGGEGKVKVATTGRVRVRVDATRAPVRVGDLLVTSDVAGVAMKSQPLDLGGVPIHRPGTLIGKALEPLEKGVGEILVLLSLQ